MRPEVRGFGTDGEHTSVVEKTAELAPLIQRVSDRVEIGLFGGCRGFWERVYQTKRPDQVSWYRPHLDVSP